MDDKESQNGKINRLATTTADQSRSIDLLRETTEDQNGKIEELTTQIGDLTTAIGKIQDRKEWSREWKAELVRLLVTIAVLGGFLISYDRWLTSKKHIATIAAQPISNTAEPH